MAKHVGARREIALTKETTRGTAVAPASGDFILHNAHTLMPQVEKAEHTGGNGTINQFHAADVIREWSQGTIPMVMEEHKLGTLGNLIMGVAPSTTGSGPYTHAWAALEQTNAHLSHTVSITDPVAGDLRAAYGMASTINITASRDDYVMADLEMICGKLGTTTYTPSYPSTNIEYFRPQDITFKVEDAYGDLAGGTGIDVQNINMVINKNVDPYYVLGSTEMADNVNQRVEIRGDFTLGFEAATYRTLGLGDTRKAISFNLTNGDYEFTIELPTVYFKDWNETADLDAYVTETISFNATDEDATNGYIKMEVIDQTATH